MIKAVSFFKKRIEDRNSFFFQKKDRRWKQFLFSKKPMIKTVPFLKKNQWLKIPNLTNQWSTYQALRARWRRGQRGRTPLLTAAGSSRCLTHWKVLLKVSAVIKPGIIALWKISRILGIQGDNQRKEFCRDLSFQLDDAPWKKTMWSIGPGDRKLVDR